LEESGVITNATNWRSRAKQGRCVYDGLPITIENERGSYRQGIDNHGDPWRTFMHIAYGYIQLTRGVDGDHVDVYLGPDEFSGKVFVIHQNDPKTGAYDEDKVMLGFNSASEARANYLRQYDSAKYFGTMDKYGMITFKQMLVDRRGLKIKKSLEKAKYIRRWRGRDGKWNYLYDQPKGRPRVGGESGTLRGMSREDARRVLKQFRRRGPGEGIEKTIQHKDHLDLLLRESTFCMVSAGRNPNDPEDMKLTDTQIRDRDKKLKADLKELGYVYTSCRGKYGAKEESIMVMAHDATHDEMMQLGAKYHQDSVLFVDHGHSALTYTTGEKKGSSEMEGSGHDYVPDAEDFYTVIPLSDGGNIKFAMSLEEVLKALDKARYTQRLKEKETRMKAAMGKLSETGIKNLKDIDKYREGNESRFHTLQRLIGDEATDFLMRQIETQSLVLSAEKSLTKAKRMAIGTISRGRKKVAEGKWVPVKQGKSSGNRSQFETWFKGSKITDSSGKPMVVYHGTPKEFTSFNPGEMGSESGNSGFFGSGFYFSKDKGTAQAYATGAKGKVSSQYLSIKNPFEISSTITQEQADILSEATYGNFEAGQSAKDVYNAVSYAAAEMEDFGEMFRQVVEQYGYDGVLFNGGQEIVAFYPEQIKQVTSNNKSLPSMSLVKSDAGLW